MAPDTSALNAAAACATKSCSKPAACAAACVPTYADLKARYDAAGQGHVFAGYASLSPEQQKAFLAHLAETDPARAVRIHAAAMAAATAPAGAHDGLKPVPADACLYAGSGDWARDAPTYRKRGLSAIADGRVALLLLAGGQGTRLGSAAPKGCYDIGLPSGLSLFGLQARRLRRVLALAGAGARAPWYIMVSPATSAATRAHFERGDGVPYFGLDARDIVFFEQGTMPAFDASGRILLEAADRLAAAPDGNGGVYSALQTAGVLADMAKRGVECVHAYCVDNALVRVLDPVFIGYSLARGAEVGVKTVARQAPEEPVGVVCCRADGALAVVEYSEIPKDLATARKAPGPDAPLVLGAANIANHFYSVSFLGRVAEMAVQGGAGLAFHVAHKKVPYFADGRVVTPTEPNGVKLELFIFDAFPLCKKFVVYEGKREDEFSPLKNKSGADSPATSRRDIMEQHLRFLRAAGAMIENENADPDVRVCEISPAVSYAGEGLEAFSGKKLKFPIIIKEESNIQ